MAANSGDNPKEPLIYAIGDVHGHLVQLHSVLRQARDYHQSHMSDRPAWLITLGDYVDRGPNSCQVIDFLINGGEELDWFARRIHLRGNHEEMMVRALENVHPNDFEMWGWNGGRETLASYGYDWPDPDSYEFNSADPFDEVRGSIPVSHLRWMKSRPFCFEYGPYFFAHAGIVPGVRLEDQKTKDLLWIRYEFVDYDGPHPKCIIHGHTPEDFVPTFGRDRICLDTGVYQCGGRLTCGVLDPVQKVGRLHECFQAEGSLL